MDIMNLKFKRKNGEVLKVYSDLFADKKNKTYGLITIEQLLNNGEYVEHIRLIRSDRNGRKFFTYDRETFYINDFIAYSPLELIKEFDSNSSNIQDEDLCATLLKYGIDSLTLKIKSKKLEVIPLPYGGHMSFEVYSNHEKPEDYEWIEYKFIEEYFRMPSDCYKLKLVPKKEEEYFIYPKKEFYVEDLIGLLNSRKDLYQIVIGNRNFAKE